MTDVSADFRPPCWCPSRWAPAWRLHTNLYKFGKNVSHHIFRKKNCCDLNLGESLCISTFFLFPVWSIQRFLFFILIYFEWRDTENQQSSWLLSKSNLDITRDLLSFIGPNPFQRSVWLSDVLSMQWQLGFFAKEFTPTYRGFDSFYGFWTSGQDYFSHVTYDGSYGLDLRRNLDVSSETHSSAST